MDKEISDKNTEAVKEMLKKSKKGALSLAVAFTITTTVTGCNDVNKRTDPSYFVTNSKSVNRTYNPEEGTTTTTTSSYHYYHHGGSYYYGRGALFRRGSWGSLSSSPSIGKSNGGYHSSKSGFSKGAGG